MFYNSTISFRRFTCPRTTSGVALPSHRPFSQNRTCCRAGRGPLASQSSGFCFAPAESVSFSHDKCKKRWIWWMTQSMKRKSPLSATPRTTWMTSRMRVSARRKNAGFLACCEPLAKLNVALTGSTPSKIAPPKRLMVRQITASVDTGL